MTKDNRVQVMMSDEELALLDEWRFAQKIGSRGEAIRRLIANGVMAKLADKGGEK